jgi:hypothetical protein
VGTGDSMGAPYPHGYRYEGKSIPTSLYGSSDGVIFCRGTIAISTSEARHGSKCPAAWASSAGEEAPALSRFYRARRGRQRGAGRGIVAVDGRP